MRIIGGKHKGKKLFTPEGDQTRPMAVRIKEAIFNKLEHAFTKQDGTSFIRNATLIDAFGGTGALALEAISRGAKHATIIELSNESYNVIQRNISAISASSHVTLVKGDATQPPIAPTPVDLAFVAPPYKKGLVKPTIEALDQKGWIGCHTLVVVEIATAEPLDIPPGYDILFDKKYRTAHIFYLKKQG